MKNLTCVALALCGAGLLFASPSGESTAEGPRELTIWEGLWAQRIGLGGQPARKRRCTRR